MNDKEDMDISESFIKDSKSDILGQSGLILKLENENIDLLNKKNQLANDYEIVIQYYKDVLKLYNYVTNENYPNTTLDVSKSLLENYLNKERYSGTVGSFNDPSVTFNFKKNKSLAEARNNCRKLLTDLNVRLNNIPVQKCLNCNKLKSGS